MRLFGYLRSLVKLVSVKPPAATIFAALVDDLYSALGSLTIGAVNTVLVGGIATWRTDSTWLAVLTVSTAAVAAARGLGILNYRKHKPAIGGDAVALRRWERWYAIGASASAACVGGLCFVAFAFTDDPVSYVLLNTNAAGFAAGTIARTASRPRIAALLLSLILLPAAIGSALHGGFAYFVLSVITFLFYLAAIEIARYSGGHRLRLLLTTREKDELARSLAEQNFRFDTALANMSHGLCMFDAERRLVVRNKRFCEITGIAPEALPPGITAKEMIELSAARGNLPGLTVSEIVAGLEARMADGIGTHSKRQLPNGRIIVISQQPMADGGAVLLFEDVTEREQAEERVRFLASHDDLTKLPNRLMFGQAVNDVVKVGRRYGQEFAVMFIDLDRFKIINDTLGHVAGDTLLIEIANRLRQCVRESDVVARVGGDEFLVLLREVSNTQQVSTVARKVLSAVVEPLTIHGHECRVTASIGISLFPSDAQDEESLIKNADAAMYAAKDEGRNNFMFHSKEIKTETIERLTLETSLRQALERNELVLHYQPKCDLGRGSISGVEALLRWRHSDLGLLQPNRFIPLAEETGLIIPIGKWVLETACTQNMAWQRQGLPATRLAVNLSPRQFADPNLLHDIRSALQKSGMPAQLRSSRSPKAW